MSSLLVSMETDSDRAQSCMFKVITVLTCLSSGNQENVLDLAIKEEHKQHKQRRNDARMEPLEVQHAAAHVRNAGRKAARLLMSTACTPLLLPLGSYKS